MATFSTAVENREHVRAEVARQQAGGKVLVDDRLGAVHLALVVDGDGDAAAADAHHHHAGLDRVLIASSWMIFLGRGEATTRLKPRPASSTITQPSFCLCWLASASLHERADRLGRVLEGLVVAVDQRLRDHRGHRRPLRPVAHHVEHGHLDLVADGALGVGAARVERHLVQLGPRELAASEDEPDLRAVAVRDHHPMTLLDEARNLLAGLQGRLVLVLDRLLLVVEDERVAAHRQDNQLAALIRHGLFRVVSRGSLPRAGHRGTPVRSLISSSLAAPAGSHWSAHRRAHKGSSDTPDAL